MDAIVTAAGLWWRGPLAALDTETTSTDVETTRILSICLALIHPDAADPANRLDLRSQIINPGVEVPAEAAAVNGLTTERVRAEGKPPADVLDTYVADVAMAIRAGSPLIVMNAPFDLTILDRECRRLGLPTLDDRLNGLLAPVIDPSVLDKKLIKYRRRVSDTQGARCLKTLAQVHNVGWDDQAAHTADYDAVQAARVVYQICARYPAVGEASALQLHSLQVGWYAEQARDLAAYWYRKANEIDHQTRRADAGVREEALAEVAELRRRADGVTFDWPMRPYAPAVTA